MGAAGVVLFDLINACVMLSVRQQLTSSMQKRDSHRSSSFLSFFCSQETSRFTAQAPPEFGRLSPQQQQQELGQSKKEGSNEAVFQGQVYSRIGGSKGDMQSGSGLNSAL